MPLVNVADWQSHLERALDRRVQVSFGRARTQPVKAQFDGARLDLRLHEFFADATEPVADDLAAWLRVGRRARKASARLDAWIDAQLASLPKSTPRATRVHLQGDTHDLAPMVQELFEHEFDFDQLPVVTWGRRGRSRARHSLQLGCYVRSQHLVRINRVLDQPFVPAWFVKFVLFHELIHAWLPPTVRPHGIEFRTRERAHPDYAASVAWQRRHIHALIRSARTGKPIR